MHPVMFALPGYTVPGGAYESEEGGTVGGVSAPYKIPLAVWMIAFLVIGYLGVRSIMED